MSSPTRERLRDLSDVVFGQRYRLEVMAAIATADDGIVCLTDLARSLDVTPSNLQRPLQSLTTAELISRLPSGDSRRRYYRRNPSLAWEFALELVRTIERSSISGSGSQPTARH